MTAMKTAITSNQTNDKCHLKSMLPDKSTEERLWKQPGGVLKRTQSDIMSTFLSPSSKFMLKRLQTWGWDPAETNEVRLA